MDIALPTEPILTAILPLPPSTNNLYKTVPWTKPNGTRTTKRVATREYLDFQKDALSYLNLAQVDWAVITHIRDCESKKQFLPLKIEMICYMERMWVRDTDNTIKAVQDTIFKRFLVLKDMLVTDLDVRKRLASGDPCCKVRLSFAHIDEGSEGW